MNRNDAREKARGYITEIARCKHQERRADDTDDRVGLQLRAREQMMWLGRLVYENGCAFGVPAGPRQDCEDCA